MRAPRGSVRQDMQTRVLLGAATLGLQNQSAAGTAGQRLRPDLGYDASLPNPKTAPKLSAAKNLRLRGSER